MIKRSQSNLITMVLIVLVGLAAVAIIAAFLISQVRDNIQTAEIKAKVSAIEIVVTDAKAGNNFIILQRTSSNPEVIIRNISIFINNNPISSSLDLSQGWNVLEAKRVNLTLDLGKYILKKGDNIEIYVLSGNVAKITPVKVTETDVILESSNSTSSNEENYVSNCGSITQSGTYTLEKDITSSGTCINIQGNNVVFDFKGHTINSNSFFNNFGIYISGSNNVTLKNGKILLFNRALMIETSRFIILDSVVFINNSVGLQIFNSNSTKVYNLSSINNSLGGIYLINATNFQVITSSSVLNNGNSSGHGIYMTNYSGLCGPIISQGNRVEDLLCEAGGIFKSSGSSIAALNIGQGCSFSFGGC